MKIFDRVYVGDNKVPAIIVGESGPLFIVDTILSGCYGVAPENLELMPEPKGFIVIDNNIPQEDIDSIKKQFNQCLENSTNHFKTPIFNPTHKCLNCGGEDVRTGDDLRCLRCNDMYEGYFTMLPIKEANGIIKKLKD